MNIRSWDAGDDSGVMSSAEATRQIRAIWKNLEELRGDLKGFRSELAEQGKSLAKIETGIERLVASMVLIPPRETCVKMDMRVTALEETVQDLEEKDQCKGCKNDSRIDEFHKWKSEMAPKLYMAVGALAVLQFAVPIAVRFIWKG